MGTKEKLIQWGWANKHGRSLTWLHWKEQLHRQPVAYWRDESGKLTRIYNVFAVQRGKAACPSNNSLSTLRRPGLFQRWPTQRQPCCVLVASSTIKAWGRNSHV